MYVRVAPVDIFLTFEEIDTLKKAYSIINEMCSKTENCGILNGREISHEKLFELLHSFELLL